MGPCGRRGEGRGRDDGMPELADGGGSEEGRDWEEGEDMLSEVEAQNAKFSHFREANRV